MHVAGLFIYPVKSLRGIAVDSAEVDALGLVGDRRFLVVNEQGQFLTQRTLPRMALIEAALTDRDLILRAPHGGSCAVPRASDPAAALLTVNVWKSTGLLAEDCGVEVAVWLSEFLRTPCRLGRIGPAYARPVLKQTGRPGDVVSFADAYPFMAISEASLTDLNDRLAARGEEALPMNRFRPNIVIAGCEPFAEDTWPRLRIGEITFRAGGPCARCIVTTTDQLTAERGKEPLRTLATYRRDAEDPTDVNFGQNLIHETKAGVLRIADLVTVS
ncbi:MAG: MOSC domain-containing protein [Verrucomicrobia bacterium]|nr:MOSC domain-containing protein [Verrucomicrobiota bacterium]